MRSRTIYDKHGDKKYEFVDGVCVFARDELAEKVKTHHVMPEIRPYQSMIDGTMITSRAQHQEHLARHNMVELGNDSSLFKHKSIPDAAPEQRKEIIAAQLNSMTQKQFKEAVKRDVDFVKWNSRGLDGAG